MFRFAIKAGIAGAAVYYTKEEGIWRDSEQSVKVLDKLNTQLKPHLVRVKSAIPYEFPKLPENIEWKQCWNYGVITTFTFLSELPDRIKKLAKDGVDSLLRNPEVKKLLEDDQKTSDEK